MFRSVGLVPGASGDVDIPFAFADTETAWRCFASSGMMVRAIRLLGEETLKKTILASLEPFTQGDGSVLQKNRFHWILAKREASSISRG